MTKHDLSELVLNTLVIGTAIATSGIATNAVILGLRHERVRTELRDPKIPAYHKEFLHEAIKQETLSDSFVPFYSLFVNRYGDAAEKAYWVNRQKESTQ